MVQTKKYKRKYDKYFELKKLTNPWLEILEIILNLNWNVKCEMWTKCEQVVIQNNEMPNSERNVR